MRMDEKLQQAMDDALMERDRRIFITLRNKGFDFKSFNDAVDYIKNRGRVGTFDNVSTLFVDDIPICKYSKFAADLSGNDLNITYNYEEL